jgi:hypothetical protein
VTTLRTFGGLRVRPRPFYIVFFSSS